MKKVFFLICSVWLAASCATVKDSTLDPYFTYGNNQFEFRNLSRSDREHDFWFVDSTTQGLEYSELEFLIAKEKGQENFGFGVVYNYRDDNNFTRLLIDVQGNVSVMTKADGMEYMILGWTYMPSLVQGLGAVNKVRIVQENDALVNIFINDQLSVFMNNGAPLVGSVGAFVAVGDKDRNANDVYVKIKILGMQEKHRDIAI